MQLETRYLAIFAPLMQFLCLTKTLNFDQVFVIVFCWLCSHQYPLHLVSGNAPTTDLDSCHKIGQNKLVENIRVALASLVL